MTRRSYRGIPPRPPAGFPVVRGWDRAPVPHPVWDAVEPTFHEPFKGITTDGEVIDGLYPLGDRGASTAAMAAAARAYLALLPADARAGLVLAIDSPMWRHWTNAFPRWQPQGVLLDDLDQLQRAAALALIEASLSPAGYAEVRNVMRLNEALGELVDDMRDTLTQWVYFFTLYGDPGGEGPWGWQLFGHHLDLHCFVLGEQVVLTPSFLGAEMCEADDGPFAGTRVFQRERPAALALLRSLSAAQRERAVLYDSILATDLPPELSHETNGRMRAGAGADNAVIPFEGLAASELSPSQRVALLSLIELHCGLLGEDQRRLRMEQIGAHIDETHFAWIGGDGDDDAFFYKIHSPVLLVEYDCHPGVFLEFDEPLPFHVHIVVRSPNGNDYGKALLAQHAARAAMS
jgi:Protein of unknown function (DUF3500)